MSRASSAPIKVEQQSNESPPLSPTSEVVEIPREPPSRTLPWNRQPYFSQTHLNLSDSQLELRHYEVIALECNNTSKGSDSPTPSQLATPQQYVPALVGTPAALPPATLVNETSKSQPQTALQNASVSEHSDMATQPSVIVNPPPVAPGAPPPPPQYYNLTPDGLVPAPAPPAPPAVAPAPASMAFTLAPPAPPPAPAFTIALAPAAPPPPPTLAFIVAAPAPPPPPPVQLILAPALPPPPPPTFAVQFVAPPAPPPPPIPIIVAAAPAPPPPPPMRVITFP